MQLGVLKVVTVMVEVMVVMVIVMVVGDGAAAFGDSGSDSWAAAFTEKTLNLNLSV